MNSFVRIAFLSLSLFSNAWGLSYLDANVPDISRGINLNLQSITLDAKTGVFTYNYSLGNPSANTASLAGVRIDIAQPIGGVVYSSAVLGVETMFDRPGANNLISAGEINVVPMSPSCPQNWDGAFAIGNYLHWSSFDDAFDIAPSSHVTGFRIKSYAPPGVRQYIAEPFLDTDALPPDQFDGDASTSALANTTALRSQLNISGFTVAPTPPTSSNPADLITGLIAYKHQVSSMSWIGDDKFVQELDDLLDHAQDSLTKGKSEQTHEALRKFIDVLSGVLRESRREDDDRWRLSQGGRQEWHRGGNFITPPAYYLLTADAQFILTQLPAPSKHQDRGGGKYDGR